jgi:two-component system LytT family response regulator
VSRIEPESLPETNLDNDSSSECTPSNPNWIPVEDWPAENRVSQPELRTIVLLPGATEGRDLQSLLEAEAGLVIVEDCRDTDFETAIRRHNPDMVVLDIGTDDGKKFQSILRNFAADRPVIFVGSDAHCAVRAFEMDAVDFLIRPLDQARVHQAIERVRRELRNVHYGRQARQMMGLLQQSRTQNQTDQLVFRINGRLVFLELNDIDWIGAAAKHVRLNAGTESYLVRESIGQLSKRLDPERFLRIHRSVIVNAQRIKELQPCNAGEYIVVLKNGKRLPCSRGFRSELERYISRCVRTVNATQ